jgi:hypothetical protein
VINYSKREITVLCIIFIMAENKIILTLTRIQSHDPAHESNMLAHGLLCMSLSYYKFMLSKYNVNMTILVGLKVCTVAKFAG